MKPNLESIKAYPRAMHFYVYTLYEFVKEMKCKNVLEIGTQNGQSTRAILMALDSNKEGRLISLDHKSRSSILDDDFQDYKKYWTFVQANSYAPETVETVKEFLGEDGLFDLAFIDGDHTYEGVKKDWDCYSKLVRPGGVIILHDTVNQNVGVSQLWNEIDWPEKFNCDWGTGRSNVTVGLGIVKKPYDVTE